MLAAHIASILWTKPGVGFQERYFLLLRLAQYIEGSTVHKMWGHFAPGALADFIGNIEEQTYRQQRVSKDQYIRRMANVPKMGSPRDPFSEGQEEVIDLQGYRLVSVSDLYTLWDGEEYHVEVYRRDPDGKVVLRYPAGDGKPEDEYEGGSAEENFCLVMEKGWHQTLGLFDGMNGELLDTEGKKIEVYRGSRLML